VIGDYLVEYLVLLPWGNRAGCWEVGKWGSGVWGVGKWGIGELGNWGVGCGVWGVGNWGSGELGNWGSGEAVSSPYHPKTLSPQNPITLFPDSCLPTAKITDFVSLPGQDGKR